MTASAVERLVPWTSRRLRAYYSWSVVVLAGTFALHLLTHPDPVGSFTTRGLANSTVTLAILAVGQTVVVILRGIDFSAVAILAFLNSASVVVLDDHPGLLIPVVIAMAVGGALAGLVNGVLVAVFQIESIVASIIMFFIWSGLALLVLERPGGSVPDGLSRVLIGTSGGIPRSAVLLIVVVVVWNAIVRTRFGVALYATGSDLDRAAASGVNTTATTIAGYALAGFFYGVAAIVYTAVSASGDPRVRFVLLAEMFAAVVIGGTRLGGGKGGALGTVIGALILVLLRTVVFSLGISSYFAGIAVGTALILAVLPHSVKRPDRPFRRLRYRKTPELTDAGR